MYEWVAMILIITYQNKTSLEEITYKLSNKESKKAYIRREKIIRFLYLISSTIMFISKMIEYMIVLKILPDKLNEE